MSRYTSPRDNMGRIHIPDSATKPFPRVHSRNRNQNSNDTTTTGTKDKLQAGLDKRKIDDGKGRKEENSKRVNAKGAAPRSSSSSDDDNKQRAGGRVKQEKSKTIKAKGGANRRSSSSDDDHKPLAGGKVNGEKSKKVKAKGATTKRASSTSDSDERSGRTRVRSPIECQCSCHKDGGRRRSPSRDDRRRKDTSADRRSSLDSIHGRFGRGTFSEASDSRTNSGKSTDDGPYRNGYKSGGGGSDDADAGNRRNRMPPININDSEARKTGKGGFTNNSRDPVSVYNPRVDSKTSHLSVTSVNSKGSSKNNKEPFRYYGRSHSAGSVTSYGGTPSQYDYAHEDFLTPRFTSEYQARYEMKMGQRYKIQPDKSIHFIDPAGQHILVPKGDNKQPMQRRNSDSDIAKNNNNIKLEPLKAKQPTDPSQGGVKKWVSNPTHVEQGGPRARPGAESRVVAPTGGGPPKRPSAHSLPPMQRTPNMPQHSDTGKALSAREETVHPLGLSSPPKRRTQLQPM